ncbi:MAG: hypothetical protein J5879_06955 [Clostridia bacterium]|nr:hypothetical protein [Clostridia bacterium]
MNVLLAFTDRDLLQCYKELFEARGDETDVAFDGAMAFDLSKKKKYDVVVSDPDISRIDKNVFYKLLSAEDVPVIELTKTHVDKKQLLRDTLPESHLAYPFSPDELFRRVDEVVKRKKERVRLDGLDIDGFMVNGKIKATNEELKLICGSDTVNGKYAFIYASSLNKKFEINRMPFRIKYLNNEGYRLVKADE